jgi:hypothetical protein
MTLALQSYTLATLRGELSTEFGGVPAAAEITSAINRAISLIWQESKTWRWSLKYLTLVNYQQATSTLFSTALIGHGTGLSPVVVNAFNPTGTPVAARWTMKITGDSNEYLVASVALGPPNPIFLQGLGLVRNSAAGATVTFQESWSLLPLDFAYMHTLRSESGNALNKKVIPVEPWVLESMRAGRLALQPAYASSQFYAIAQDPFPYTDTNWTPNRQYISFFPYPAASTITKWDGYYYAVPKDLVDDTDIAEVPTGWRRRLFFRAAELVAAKLRDWEAMKFYGTQAQIGAALMADCNSFGDDLDTPMRQSVWTFSDLVRNSVVTP